MVVRERIGAGLGAQVLSAAEGEIVDRGGTWARLDAVTSNQKLVGWYRGRGYAVIGQRVFNATGARGTSLLEKEL